MSDGRQDNQNEGLEPAARPLPPELLSAYLDDPADLAAEDLQRVEALLESDPETRRALAELRLIAGELRELPRPSAPRSYHLDREMVGIREPVVLHRTVTWHERSVLAVRWATAAAAILFVFVLGADLVLHGIQGGQPDGDDDALPMREAQISAPREIEEEDEEESAAADLAMPEEAADDAAMDEGEVEDPQIMADDADAEDEAGDALPTDDALPPSEPGDGDEEARDDTAAEDTRAVETEAADAAMFAFDDPSPEASSEEESSRRVWRIVQFSLVVLLGALISAMVLLRRAGPSARHRSG